MDLVGPEPPTLDYGRYWLVDGIGYFFCLFSLGVGNARHGCRQIFDFF